MRVAIVQEWLVTLGGSDPDNATLKVILALHRVRGAPLEATVVVGAGNPHYQSLEKAGRVADFLELAELLCIDALHRTESCGAHFRVESQTEEGEALRDDEHFAYVAAWHYGGEGKRPLLRKEPLDFENVHLAVRSYK